MNEEIRILDTDAATSFFERYRLLFDIGLHLILLALAISPFVVLFMKRKTPVSLFDFYCLLAAILALPVGVGLSLNALPEYAVPFVRGYTILCFIVLLISLGIVVWKLQKQSSGSYALTVINSLLILGLVIGLMLPAVPSAREAARRMQCMQNLKQLMAGILSAKAQSTELRYAQDCNAPEIEGGPDVSWRVKLLPFIEQTEIKDRYHPDQSWNSESNWEVAKQRLPIYTCPSEPPQMNAKGGRYTSYAMLSNSNRAQDNPNLVRPIKNEKLGYLRIQIIESCGANLIWTEPRDVDLDTFAWSIKPESEAVKKKPWNSRNVGSSIHEGGTQAAFGDGSVRFLSEQTDPKLLRALILGEATDDGLE